MTDTLVSINAHPKALDTIGACLEQCQAIETAWGTINAEYGLKAYRSLAQVLARFFTGQGFGPETLYRDGDLSLFTNTESGFVFGTIFHRTNRPDPPVEGDLQVWVRAPMLGRYCFALIEETKQTEVGPLDTHRYCTKPYQNGKPTCDCTRPFAYVMPVPGEWSNHS